MNNDKQAFLSLCDRFNQRNQRERLIILVATLLVFYTLWNHWVYTPLTEKSDQLQSAIEEAQHQNNEKQMAIGRLIASKSGRTEKKLQRELTAVQQQLDETVSTLDTLSSTFISSSEMVRILKHLLREEKSLQLVKLENIPTDELNAASSDKASKQATVVQDKRSRSNGPRIFKHAFVMELEGDYLSTLSYLQAIEKLPWRITLDSIAYTAQESGADTIQIHLHTLSLSEGWISV